jgi:hypothetical protein
MIKQLVLIVVFFMITPATAEVIFPDLEADDLNGRTLSLPKDLPGQPTIVLIAFKRKQQSSVDAWVDRLDLLPEGGPAWIEMPVVGRGAAIFRSFVDKGMRAGITSEFMRGRTITIYSSRRAFNNALGIRSMKDIYVALVDPNGTVHILIQGDVSEEKMKKLRSAYP